ncbi:hypothetical protein [Deinococcus sonorensis]|uniref:Transposase n=1 Tax=Deinococcus sonorensis KR-87 TaxID=694439 RepID=A0AAU7UGT1_9DEIO
MLNHLVHPTGKRAQAGQVGGERGAVPLIHVLDQPEEVADDGALPSGDLGWGCCLPI